LITVPNAEVHLGANKPSPDPKVLIVHRGKGTCQRTTRSENHYFAQLNPYGFYKLAVPQGYTSMITIHAHTFHTLAESAAILKIFVEIALRLVREEGKKPQRARLRKNRRSSCLRL
jgi:hypothetical protein